jgi:ATP-dependent RNA helicase RhlE
LQNPYSCRGCVQVFARKYGEKSVRVLHANKGQNTRINSINSFKNDEVKILVATDVASRGIDVSDVSHVINFDVPVVIEDYVHRIGRTGQCLQSGEAITFCNRPRSITSKRSKN